jgi:hypothetical protein
VHRIEPAKLKPDAQREALDAGAAPSAMADYMALPSELGLTWNADEFGI